MKKVFFLVLTLMVLSAASVNAQVRIGGSTDPNPSALLDLNATDTTTVGKLGLALPRVKLVSTTDVATIASPATGLIVYNMAAAGSGVTAVRPGIYIFNGTTWTSTTVSGAPVITTQPAKFTFSRLRDTTGDPNGAASFSKTLTVAANDATSYQWYKKSRNVNVADTLLTGATSASYTFSIPATATVANWGLYAFYCVVSNAFGSTKSDIAEIALGCGAKTNDGGWLSVACYNLGADPSLDPFVYNSKGDTTSFDIKGWLFQFGRAADGNQWRSSIAIAGPDTIGNATQVAVGSKRYGKFITNNQRATLRGWAYPAVSVDWRDDMSGPCSAGWQPLSPGDVKAITPNDSHSASTEYAQLRWNRGKLWESLDGVVTLFLPAIAQRYGNSGAVENVDYRGVYWLRSTSNGVAAAMLVSEGSVTDASYFDSQGYGVRCKRR
jgi:hypothetical protein